MQREFCPEGLTEILVYTKKKMNNPIIYVTENGKLNTSLQICIFCILSYHEITNHDMIYINVKRANVSCYD